jgi:hypothetical protein
MGHGAWGMGHGALGIGYFFLSPLLPDANALVSTFSPAPALRSRLGYQNIVSLGKDFGILERNYIESPTE